MWGYSVGIKIIISVVIISCVVLFVLDELMRLTSSGFKGSQPLTDDEFMTLLPEGTNREIAMKVRTIVAEQTGWPRESIRPDTNFIDL